VDWRVKVELFEQIRREYEFGVGTIAGVSKQLGGHRRMVREAVASAIPRPRKKTKRPRLKLAAAVKFIDDVLEADRQAPRKQRHTARRIWERMGKELPECPISARTVRQYVQECKHELGLGVQKICVPQSYNWGSEAQVDWYEAYADVAGERIKLQVFSMRSMASGAAFHQAYLHATQQAFLEAHEQAFAYFGGVFKTLRYDNLVSAVKKILRGSQREQTTRFVEFRSHWRFAAEFCTLAEPHEKGGVEGEVGYFRRNHWVPVPCVDNIDTLNQQLLASCREDESRLIAGHQQSVGAGIMMERSHLLPLLEEGLELAQVSFSSVNSMGCVPVRTNVYSVPLPVGTQVQAKIHASRIELWHDGYCVAKHERSYGRKQQILDLEHYLDVLSRKPGALAGSTPLVQWRQSGLWPASFDQLWQSLIERNGKQSGTKQMIELVKLSRLHGHDKLRQAIELALSTGCHDAAAAVKHLITADDLKHVRCEAIDIGFLDRYTRPLPVMTEYDQLLSVGGAQ
jgi:transposase